MAGMFAVLFSQYLCFSLKIVFDNAKDQVRFNCKIDLQQNPLLNNISIWHKSMLVLLINFLRKDGRRGVESLISITFNFSLYRKFQENSRNQISTPTVKPTNMKYCKLLYFKAIPFSDFGSFSCNSKCALFNNWKEKSC